MFGYVRPKKDELKVKELAYYKSVYCGLCREEKKLSARLNLLLSYDMVLYALLRIGATGEKSRFGKTRCAANPFKRRVYVKESPALRLSSAVSALLVYYKLLDDINDERGLKKLRARFLLPGVAKAVKKSAFPELETLVREGLSALSELEKEESDSVYECAQAFGELLGKIFAYDPPGPEKADAAESGKETPSKNEFSAEYDSSKEGLSEEGLLKEGPSSTKKEGRKKPKKERSKKPKGDPYPSPPALSASQRTCLYELGCRVGRWIYMVDAAADAADDAEKGRFNPFIKAGDDIAADEFKDRIFFASGVELSLALSALDLLSIEDDGIDSIIRNILGMGMADTSRSVIYGCEKDRKKMERRTKDSL